MTPGGKLRHNPATFLFNLWSLRSEVLIQLFRSIWQPTALEARHHLSGYSRVSGGCRLPFADYVTRSRDMLHVVHAGAVNPGKIVDGNAPFELKPLTGYSTDSNKTYRRGVLL
ncbi:MAG: hypothetical protein WAW75_10155, partial [Gallionella sp.]